MRLRLLALTIVLLAALLPRRADAAATIIHPNQAYEMSVATAGVRFVQATIPRTGPGQARQPVVVSVVAAATASCAVNPLPCLYASTSNPEPTNASYTWSVCPRSAADAAPLLLSLPAGTPDESEWVYLGVSGEFPGCTASTSFVLEIGTVTSLAGHASSFPGKFSLTSRLEEGAAHFYSFDGLAEPTGNHSLLVRLERCSLASGAGAGAGSSTSDADVDAPPGSDGNAAGLDFTYLQAHLALSDMATRTPTMAFNCQNMPAQPVALPVTATGSMVTGLCPAAEFSFYFLPTQPALLAVSALSWIARYTDDLSSVYTIAVWKGMHLTLPSRALAVTRNRNTLTLHMAGAKAAQLSGVVGYRVYTDLMLSPNERAASVTLGGNLMSSSCFLLSRPDLYYNGTVNQQIKSDRVSLALPQFYASDMWVSRVRTGRKPRITVVATDNSGRLAYFPAEIPVLEAETGLADWTVVAITLIVGCSVCLVLMVGIALWRLSRRMRSVREQYVTMPSEDGTSAEPGDGSGLGQPEPREPDADAPYI